MPPVEDWKKAAAEVLKDYATRLGDGPFFAGAAPGYGEAYVFHNLDNCFGLGASPGWAALVGEEAAAKLKAFYDAFAALDGVKEYLEKRKERTYGMPGSFAQGKES